VVFRELSLDSRAFRAAHCSTIRRRTGASKSPEIEFGKPHGTEVREVTGVGWKAEPDAGQREERAPGR
jgi:hypothetical protein